MTEASEVLTTKHIENNSSETSSELLEWECVFFSGQEINEDLRQEIRRRVKVKKVNGMWVCFIADEVPQKGKKERIAWANHQTEFLGHFVGNPNTVGVMIEYFAPELKYKARNSSPLARPFIQSNLHSRYQDRVFGFNHLARLAKQNYTDVFVADIANTPTYQALRIGWGYAPGAVAAVVSSRPNSPFALVMSSMGGGLVSAVAQEAISRVTSNKNKLEDIIPTPEDARRVFIAKGVQVITSMLSDGSEENKGRTLLVVYPRAHINRIIEYEDSGRWKEKIYKAVLPGLDYFVRRYKAITNTEPNQHSDNGLSGWELAETIPL